jgi:hypothetical protein
MIKSGITFTLKKELTTLNVFLPRRSVLILNGKARLVSQIGIPARKIDIVNSNISFRQKA